MVGMPGVFGAKTEQVGQEIVPAPVMGLGVATIGDVAATLVTLPVPPVMKFVSLGATLLNVVVSTWAVPLMVTAVGGVHCVPVPSGGWIPPELLQIVNCHCVLAGVINPLGHRDAEKLPVALRAPLNAPWMAAPPTLGFVPAGTN